MCWSAAALAALVVMALSQKGAEPAPRANLET
jgi:hypothetical protein